MLVFIVACYSCRSSNAESWQDTTAVLNFIQLQRSDSFPYSRFPISHIALAMERSFVDFMPSVWEALSVHRMKSSMKTKELQRTHRVVYRWDCHMSWTVRFYRTPVRFTPENHTINQWKTKHIVCFRKIKNPLGVTLIQRCATNYR